VRLYSTPFTPEKILKGLAEKEKEECGGTRFLQKAGFPRTPSGKNS